MSNLNISLCFVLVLIMLASGCARSDYIRSDLLNNFNKELKETNDNIIYFQLKAISLGSVSFNYRLKVREAMTVEDIQSILLDMVIPFIHSDESTLEHEKVINDFGLNDGIYSLTVEIYKGPKTELEYMTYEYRMIENVHTWTDREHDSQIEYKD